MNLEQIKDLIASENRKAITDKLKDLISAGDQAEPASQAGRLAVRQLLIEAMLFVDVRYIHEYPDDSKHFLQCVLKGENWDGYCQLDDLGLVSEFKDSDKTQEELFEIQGEDDLFLRLCNLFGATSFPPS